MMKKITPIIAGVLLLIAASIMAVKYYELRQERNQLLENATLYQSELQKADLDKGRANTKIKELSDKVDNMSTTVRKEVKVRKAIETLYAELEAKYRKTKKGKLKVVKVPEEKIVVVEKDGTTKPIKSLPFSYKDFRIDIKGDAVKEKIEYTLHQSFKVKLLETRMDGGIVNHYAELQEINRETGKVVGKLEIDRFEVIKAPPQKEISRFHLLDPSIQLFVNIGSTITFDNFFYGADLGLSISSYGKPNDKNLRFFRVGINGDSAGGISGTFAPVILNLADSLPLFNNLWVMPSVGYRINSNEPIVNIGLGASL